MLVTTILSFIAIGVFLGVLGFLIDKATSNFFIGLIPLALLTVAYGVLVALQFWQLGSTDAWIGLSITILTYVYTIILVSSYLTWLTLTLLLDKDQKGE